jgi:hypothetical protein
MWRSIRKSPAKKGDPASDATSEYGPHNASVSGYMNPRIKGGSRRRRWRNQRIAMVSGMVLLVKPTLRRPRSAGFGA